MLGCSKNDTVPSVSPNINQIYFAGGINTAYLFKENEIVVIADNYLFYTNNLFQKLDRYPVGHINETLTPTITEQYIIFQNIYYSLSVQMLNRQGSVSTIDIEKSNSWYSSNPSASNPGILRDGAFLNEEIGWILNNKDDGKLVLEKYADNKSQEIFQFQFNDGRIRFYDNLFGYIFLPYRYFSSYYVSPGNVYMATTSDGGLSWTEPRLIGVDINIWDIQMLSKNTLIIKQKYDGNDFLFTKDGGLTWSKVIIPSGYTLEQIISCDLAIIKKDGYFSIYDAKSSIILSNITSPIVNLIWTAKVCFISADTGIIYTESEMYITYDKGQNWKKLIKFD
ncbi:MAG: exo-alpha-sialidase [Candidatus Methanofastidiosum sp.]|nr:exo-alpha-sialidase [Methanofastidiosum sp.]